MKRLLLAIAAGFVLALPASSSAATASVRITSVGFAPAQVTLTSGDTITWTNNTIGKHQIVSEDGGFVSPVLKSGQSYSYTFKTAGSFAYHDSLHPARKGAVTVKGAPADVKLDVSPTVVTYGSATVLTGSVSGGTGNETVTISSRPAGAPAFQQAATVTTASDGTFKYVVRPASQTTYTATWKDASSQTVTVQVRPRLTLAHYGATRFYARAHAAGSLGGSMILLQRLTGYGWTTVGRLTLGPNSGRIFLAPHLRGYRTYRVYLSSAEAGNGYLAATSNKVRISFRR